MTALPQPQGARDASAPAARGDSVDAAWPDAPTVRPETMREAREAVLADAGPDGGPRLLLRGGATKLDWGAAPEGVDRVIDTGGLRGLVRHDRRDLTATVRAGTALADLQHELAASGQWLAVDPPLHDGAGGAATIGGVVAAAAHGPRRLGHGAVRDLVIGTTFLLADGAVARSGGNVIKNVAGYDIAKLLCGSLGTLALILEVTVRLHPLPAATASVVAPATAAEAHHLAVALSDAQLEPCAVDHRADLRAGHGEVLIRMDGAAAVVADHARAAADVAAVQGLRAEVVADDADLWDEVVAGLDGRAGETVVVIGGVPSAVGQVEASARRAAQRTGVTARWHSHVALGLHTLRLSGADASGHAAAVTALRNEGWPAVLRRRVEGVDAHVPAWPGAAGRRETAVGLMRAVKQRLDPHRRLAPGRLMDGI